MLISMSDGIWIAIITGVFSIIGLLVTKRLNRLEAEQKAQGVKTKAIHHEVNNNGGSSMKDGVDRAVRLIEKLDLEFKGEMKAVNLKLDGALVQVTNNQTNIEHLRTETTNLDEKVTQERKERLEAEHRQRGTD